MSPTQPTQTAEPQYDFFVCHASDDKATAAAPIAERLRARGYRVWFDRFELTIGDRLPQKIDQGLAVSRYGIVVLSPRFFAKAWPRAELDALASRELREGEKVVLPVWHEIDVDGVAQHSPLLASKLGVPTSRGLDAVVDEIVAAFNAAGHTGAVAPPAAHAPVDAADGVHYDSEEASAGERYLELLGGLLPRPAAFRHIDFRPARYSRSRFRLADLRSMAASASIDFKGWPILFYNAENSKQSHAIDGGLQTFVSGEQWRWHFWRLMTSGYLFGRELLPDNRFGAADGRRFFVDVERLGPDIAEAVHALLALYEGRLERDEFVSLRFALLRVDGWHLGSSDPGRDFDKNRYSCEAQQVVVEESHRLFEWRERLLDIATAIYASCCEMFNWQTPDVERARAKMDDTLAGRRRL